MSTAGTFGITRSRTRISASAPAPNDQSGDDGVTIRQTTNETRELGEEAVCVHGEPEELRELTDEDREREAVHVTELRGLREKIGDEAELRGAGEQHDRADEEREHRGKQDGPRRIAARSDEGDDRRCDHRPERRVGAEDERSSKARQARSRSGTASMYRAP